MHSLIAIRQLIKKMGTDEIKLSRKFITGFNSRGESEPNKGDQLIALLLEEKKTGKEFQIKEIEKLLYGRVGTSAFLRLVFRVKDKLFESLLLSTNLHREGAYSERGRELHEVRKDISIAEILLDRGLQDVTIEMLNDIINRCTKYEFYEECLSAVKLRLELGSFNTGIKSYNADKKLYDQTLLSLACVKKAVEYYSMLLADVEFKATPGFAKYSKRLESQISELYADLKATSSAYVAFYLNYIEAHHLQMQCRYKAASNILKELVGIIVQYPAIKTNSRLAGAIINFAWNELYCYNFSNAITEIENAEKLLPQNHINLYQCYEAKFYGCFYLKQYDKAKECLELLNLMDNGSLSAFRNGRREYLLASVYFMQTRFDKAAELLRDLNPIEVDDLGWNLGIRFLYILNDIEQEKTDNAELRIENLRKHLEKQKKKTVINRRDWVKYDILKELVYTHFDFTQVQRRKRQELEELSSTESEIKWIILGAEIIPFQNWFESRLFKNPMELKLPKYVEPIRIETN